MYESGLFPSGVHEIKRSPLPLLMSIYYNQKDIYDVISVAISTDKPRETYDMLIKEKSLPNKKHEDDVYEKQLAELDNMEDFIKNIGKKNNG